MKETVVSDRMAKLVLTIDRWALAVTRHWLLAFNVAFGILVLAPFAAPALMALGASGPANAIYFFYSLFCHQLPQRSFFLFGPKVSYAPADIARVWPFDNYWTLREFIGNAEFGWKVAWSDRMVTFYGSLWVGGLLFAPLRRRLPRLSPVVWLFIGILPVGVDGSTHMVNDAVGGITGTGFRDTNAWLQVITGNLFPATFYAGDAVGSFNSLMRLVTGTLFGLTTIWFLFTYLEESMRDMERQMSARLGSPRASALGCAEARLVRASRE